MPSAPLAGRLSSLPRRKAKDRMSCNPTNSIRIDMMLERNNSQHVIARNRH